MLYIALSAPYSVVHFFDFRAFYCAGQVLDMHADPYREHPLSECERSLSAADPQQKAIHTTVPAPFPGYVLALFAGLGWLSFTAALVLWTGAACFAVVAATVLIARATLTPLTPTAIVLAFPAATVALPLGQLTPFILLAIAGTAILLQIERPRLAAVVALGAMLDPHVGLALVVGIAAGVPRTRATLLAGFGVLIVLGSAVSGPAQELEYVRSVLPAHALANVADWSQFSTTNFAYMVGVPTRIALALGGIWYIAALAVGTFAALRLRERLGTAATALIPPAFAVFGGTHTHLAQLAMAVPAFLLVCSAARGRKRVMGVVITFVAAMPWLAIVPFPLLYPATAVLAIPFAYTMGIRRQAVRLAAATIVALLGISVAIVRLHTGGGVPKGEFVAGNPLAEVSWQMFILARNTPPEYGYLFAKAPTVLAFLVLLGALVNAALQRPATIREC